MVQARGDDTSDEEDIPVSMIAKATAKKWVEKNKINKKMDKTAEDYVQRVLVLISSGSSDRAELRTRKARAEAQAENGTLDPLLVATEAHIYYNKVMRRVVKRPKKPHVPNLTLYPHQLCKIGATFLHHFDYKATSVPRPRHMQTCLQNSHNIATKNRQMSTLMWADTPILHRKI